MNFFLITIIKAYQKLVSPFLGRRCRFFPSCSSYTVECLQNLPVRAAIGYTLLRILKCHPFHRGGYDPAPLKKWGEEN